MLYINRYRENQKAREPSEDPAQRPEPRAQSQAGCGQGCLSDHQQVSTPSPSAAAGKCYC